MSLFDDATLILTPNGYSESELYSIKPTGLTSTLTVVRSTTATRINSDGEVEITPYNLVSYSEDLTNAYWIKSDGLGTRVTVTANQAISPRGDLTADLLVPTISNFEHPLSPNIASTLPGNVQTSFLTWSVYVKPAGYNYFGLRTNINNTWSAIFFDIQNGTVFSTSPNFVSYDIESVGNGWYLLTVVTQNITTINFQHISSPTGAITFSGDGVSGTYVWGTQIVVGTKRKDYFKTTNRLNVPRLDYLSGLTPTILLEPQTTNFILNSQTITNTWGVGGPHQVTDDFFLLNSGKNLKVLTSDSINTNAGSMCIRTLGLSNIIKSGVNTLSFFLKKTSNHNSLTVWGFVASGGTGTGSYTVNFNVDTLVVSRPQTATRFTNRSGAIIPLGNNIFYCYESFTSDANYTIPLGFSPTTSGSFTMVPGQEMSIGGFQMEQIAYPTSYVPSLTSSATRNSDNVTLTGLTSNGILSSGGTWFFDVNLPQTRFSSGNSLFFSVYNGIYVNAIMVNVTNAGYGIYLRPGTLASTIIYSTNATFNTMKMAISWSTVTGQMKIYFNGSLVNTTNGLTLSDYTTLSLSDANGGLNTLLRTRLNLMAFYNTILSDTQCIQLTN
jgi:hypothetical protein